MTTTITMYHYLVAPMYVPPSVELVPKWCLPRDPTQMFLFAWLLSPPGAIANKLLSIEGHKTPNCDKLVILWNDNRNTGQK